MIRAEEFIEQWLGAPYRYDGKTTAGVDCYGLVRAFYAEVRGEALPDWERGPETQKWYSEVITREVARHMTLIDAPQDEAIAVARKVNICHHMGIYWRGYILHCTANTPVCLTHVRDARILFGGAIIYGFPD